MPFFLNRLTWKAIKEYLVDNYPVSAENLAAVADGTAGADAIGLTPVALTGAANTVQEYAEALPTALAAVADGTAGADAIGATVQTATGAAATVQAQLEAIVALDAAKMPLAGGTFSGHVTMTTAKNVVLASAGAGTQIGTAADQKLAFRGSTPIVLPAAAAQAAAPAGGEGATAGAYDTAQHRDALIALVNAMRTVLIDQGLMKGSA